MSNKTSSIQNIYQLSNALVCVALAFEFKLLRRCTHDRLYGLMFTAPQPTATHRSPSPPNATHRHPPTPTDTHRHPPKPTFFLERYVLMVKERPCCIWKYLILLIYPSPWHCLWIWVLWFFRRKSRYICNCNDVTWNFKMFCKWKGP